MSRLDSIRGKLPFFEHLNNDEQEAIENGLVVRNFSKGQLVSDSTGSCMGMVIVQKGDVRVSIISEDGRQITLFHVNEGEVCVTTASCVISQLTFDSVVSAEVDTELWVIPSALLKQLSDNNIYVKAYMYELLTERFSTVVWVMEQILFKGIDHRVASYLVSCCEKSGSNVIAMTQEAIAAEVNTAREVVARMLKQFAADGYVELKRGKIIIRDIDALQEI